MCLLCSSSSVNLSIVSSYTLFLLIVKLLTPSFCINLEYFLFILTRSWYRYNKLLSLMVYFSCGSFVRSVGYVMALFGVCVVLMLCVWSVCYCWCGRFVAAFCGCLFGYVLTLLVVLCRTFCTVWWLYLFCWQWFVYPVVFSLWPQRAWSSPHDAVILL